MGSNEAGNFVAELKRRHVYRVAIAYGVVAWLLIQVATQVFPFFELSNFVVRVVVAASVLGFPVALIIAWAFEMTPQGLKRADDVAPDELYPPVEHTEVCGAGCERGDPGSGCAASSRPPKEASLPLAGQSGFNAPQKSIAVLPLLNESGNPVTSIFRMGYRKN